MSKSLGNAIGIREPAEEMYGKVMSIPDAILPRWIELLRGESRVDDARAAKAALARQLVARFHDEEAAAAAEAHFDRVFRQKQAPEDLAEVEIPRDSGVDPLLVEVIQRLEFASSRSAGRRLIRQGGVRLDEQRVADPEARVGTILTRHSFAFNWTHWHSVFGVA